MQRITLNLLIINRYIYSLSGDHNIDFEIGTESSDANVSESTTLSSFNSSLQQSFCLLLQKAKYGLTESIPLILIQFGTSLMVQNLSLTVK